MLHSAVKRIESSAGGIYIRGRPLQNAKCILTCAGSASHSLQLKHAQHSLPATQGESAVRRWPFCSLGTEESCCTQRFGPTSGPRDWAAESVCRSLQDYRITVHQTQQRGGCGRSHANMSAVQACIHSERKHLEPTSWPIHSERKHLEPTSWPIHSERKHLEPTSWPPPPADSPLRRKLHPLAQRTHHPAGGGTGLQQTRSVRGRLREAVPWESCAPPP